MNKVFVIAKREFRERVGSGAFLFTAIGTPLILIVIWFFTGNLGTGAQNQETLAKVNPDQAQARVGVIDQAGVIEVVPDPLRGERFPSFPDEEAAAQALEKGLIEAYYVVPENYRKTGEVQRFSNRLPTSPPNTDPFEYLLISNLFSDLDSPVLSRLRDPIRDGEPRFISLVGVEETGSGEIENTMLPFIVTMAIMLPLFTGGGYLLQSLTKEKGSKVMEVLLVTIRPRQLLTGKLLGLGALVLVQYGLWVLIAGVLFTVLNQEPSAVLSSVRISSQELVFVLPFAVGGFCLYAGLMGGLGALAPDMEGGRTWTFFITLPMLAPIYFWTGIAGNPNGPLAVALSLFPYSSPVAMLLRMTVTAVSNWQLGLSLAILFLAVIGTVWAMSRLFHAQTLLSGESLSLRRFWEAFHQT